MFKRLSGFLILVFALNICLTSLNFPAFADGTKVKIEEKKETKSAFQKAIELVAKPFAYIFHKIYFSFLGPPELGIAYNIQIDKVYKPTSKPNVYSDEPGKKVENVKVFVPVILLNGKAEAVSSNDFLEGVNAKVVYFKKVKNVYKFHDEKYKKINASKVPTKYGNMIELSYPGEIDPFFHIELVADAKPRKIYRVFPYHLSNEYSLGYEEDILDMKTESGKGFQETGEKIATYVYVSWKGRGQLKLDFWIGAGAHFGYAGSNGLGYFFCREQMDKTVEFQEIKSTNYLKRNLIFRKPGWYKICMKKKDYISAL